jgi:hypothetical protein
VTEKTVGGLEDYTNYYVRVRARNLLTGDSTNAAETSARTPDTRAPSAPTLDARGLLNTVLFDWSASTDIGITLRGGYMTRDAGNGSDGLSAGLGFGWGNLGVDYAFVSHGDLDPSQVISIYYGFQ